MWAAPGTHLAAMLSLCTFLPCPPPHYRSHPLNWDKRNPFSLKLFLSFISLQQKAKHLIHQRSVDVTLSEMWPQLKLSYVKLWWSLGFPAFSISFITGTYLKVTSEGGVHAPWATWLQSEAEDYYLFPCTRELVNLWLTGASQTPVVL